MRQRIVAVHLLNDRSGSPFVLGQSLSALVESGNEILLYTSTPEEGGFLVAGPGLTIRDHPYTWHPNKLLTLLFYTCSQVWLFVRLFFTLRKSDIVYVNSLLPFGAALAGWTRRCDVVYHFHEVSIRPEMLRSFLIGIAQLTATQGIFVSWDLYNRTGFRGNSTVIHNALPEAFIQRAKLASAGLLGGAFTVLMLCSLKKYKGVMEFLAIARKLPMMKFLLVLNASESQMSAFFSGISMPENLELFPAQKDVHPFYERSNVVVNLSHPEEWVETFGMTILEAMSYGRPVIIPPVGGITELVTDGCEGFHIDPFDVDDISARLVFWASQEKAFEWHSRNARLQAERFSQKVFATQVQDVFQKIMV